MNPDELDELLSRSLRAPVGSPSTSGDGGALGDIVRRGRSRRRRRNSLAAAIGAIALAAVGASVVSGRGHDRGQRVIVAAPSVSNAPTSSAAAAGVSTTTASTTAPVGVSSAALSFVAVRDGTYELWTSAGKVGSFVPCPATESGCRVPVVSVVGEQIWYIVERAGGSRALMHVSASDVNGPRVVDEPVGSKIVDVSGVGDDDFYVIEYADVDTRTNTLIHVHDGVRDVIASGVFEVVATPAGRLAYVTSTEVVVRETLDGPARVVSFGSIARPGSIASVLSWAPNADSLILGANGPQGRDGFVLDVAGAETLDAARRLDNIGPACWISDDRIGALRYSRRPGEDDTTVTGEVIGIDRLTLAATPYGSAQHRTEQIACEPDGSIALVELASGASTGDLVRLHADGSVDRLGSGYSRVRSIR